MRLQLAWRGGNSEGRRGWWLKFPYDRAFLERFKRAISHEQRAWDKDAQAWWVAEAYEGRLQELFPGFGAYLQQQELPL